MGRPTHHDQLTQRVDKIFALMDLNHDHQRRSPPSHSSNANALSFTSCAVTFEEFKEGSKKDPTIVQVRLSSFAICGYADTPTLGSIALRRLGLNLPRLPLRQVPSISQALECCKLWDFFLVRFPIRCLLTLHCYALGVSNTSPKALDRSEGSIPAHSVNNYQ